MFKSTRKRQTNRLTFQEQLSKQLHQLKQQTPQKPTYIQKNKQIVTIIDEVVNELKTPIERTPRKQSQHIKIEKQNQIHEMDSLQLDENSSISLNSKEGMDDMIQDLSKYHKKVKNHISNLVSHPEIIKILVQNFSHYTQNQNIQFYDFIKKIYMYYFNLTLKDQEIFLLKNRLKFDLTTTNPQYLSLNALEIIGKRHNLLKYLQSAYIAMKIEQKISDFQKKNKKLIQQFGQKEDELKERQQRLVLNEQQFEKRQTALILKEKGIMSKSKELTIRQKQLKKSVEEKTMKLYQSYLTQFAQKVKQTQKRLNNTEKNIKYKIDILQRRSQTLKLLISQKNDLKNKKIMSENEAKIKLRRIQKQMDQLDKRHQSEIQLFERQEKDLLKSISILQQKLSKNQKKCMKQKQRIMQLQQQLTNSSQKFEKMVQKCSQIEHKLLNNQQESSKVEQLQVKLSKEKTNRSSKNKKKPKSSQIFQLLFLYEKVLHSIISINSISHFQYQQIIQGIMKCTVKELPQLIYHLTAAQQEQNTSRQPHYLVLHVTKIIVQEFYYLNNKQKVNTSRNSKLKSADIQELLKYPYPLQANFSIFLLFLDVYDWNQPTSATFFSKTIHKVVEQIQEDNILKQNQLKQHQLRVLTSTQCSFFFVYNFYTQLIFYLESLEKSPRNWLKISISLTDLFLLLIKLEENDTFAKLSQNKIEQILLQTLLIALEGILSLYNNTIDKNKAKVSTNTILFESLQQLEEFSEKMSIFIQRFYHKYANKLNKIPQIKRFKGITDRFQELNRSNGNRHSLILANLKSILGMVKQNQ